MKRSSGSVIIGCLFTSFTLIVTGCSDQKEPPALPLAGDTTLPEISPADHTVTKPPLLPSKTGVIETGMTTPDELTRFAMTLTDVPYLYASTDPAKGFDCSGFITYVFNHFNIAVPRSSIDFTDLGTEVDSTDAKPGDLILFTGTDSTIRRVGHMGIVISNEKGRLQFIHSSSGKANGVVITPLERYYRGRFVKVIRVFPENN